MNQPNTNRNTSQQSANKRNEGQIPNSNSHKQALLDKCIRLTDFCIALVCLFVFSPLFIICSLIVFVEDGKDIIYKQERIGKGGKPFMILKFRTMRHAAEADGPQLSANDTEDPRLLKAGRWLRKHHLDELPQLLNVLKGDMALVGPRPERLFYIKQIMKQDSRYELLYQVRPGVTSYATLYNGYTDTIEKMLKRLELDLYYINHRSILLNMRILWLTFFKIVSGHIF